MHNDHFDGGSDDATDSAEAASTPSESFVDLRLTGGRFEKSGFPVNGLVELERLEELIETVAKALWKRDNPGRSRAPKNFTSSFDLRLTRVDPGSVIPVLERSDTDQGLFNAAFTDYFDASMEVIEDAFASIVDNLSLPDDFPEEAEAVMARFGSSFHEDERAIFRSATADPISYSSSVRKEFFGGVRNTLLVQDGSHVGRISALDVDEQTFTFAPVNSSKVPGVYQDPQRWADLHEVLKQESDNYWVRLQGTFRFRPDSSIHSVADVASVEVFDVPDSDWGRRLLELADLQDGWIEEGEAVATPSLECAREVLTHLASKELRPGIFPTPAGGIQLEWSAEDERFVVAISSDVELETRRSNRKTRSRTAKHPEDVDALIQIIEEWVA
ncbi:hypothetical protein [Arthrobacter sp. AFG20]|uniref:hypothetical protein n=1 Tax=Arthrobacter sp. AFG20 TaxID=1688671 RepID=UPI000C9E211F|nr:hypothetical protein [Arthrobacter sp. AFG20]PNH79228.1 hypothetical protein CXZ05_20760 [Arthrobacter sp. AFG20]